MQLPYMRLWNLIFDMIDLLPDDFVHFAWIPGHMESEEKRGKYQNFLDDGQVAANGIEGNQYADQLAEKGANMHAIPPEVLVDGRDRADLSELIQQHLVCSWTVK